MTFIEWLSKKLEEKQMTMHEVARRSNGKVSHATISRIMSGKQRPTCDVCIGIAEGLDESPHLVLEIAGILGLPIGMMLTTEQMEWLRIFDKLSDESRAEILDLARLKVVRERRIKYDASKQGGAQ